MSDRDDDDIRIEEAARRAAEAAKRAEEAAKQREGIRKEGKKGGPGEPETYGQGRRGGDE